MTEHTVIPSVPNSIKDNFGNEWGSIRALAQELQIHRNRITKILKENGSFQHNGKIYTLKSTPVIKVDLKDVDLRGIKNV